MSWGTQTATYSPWYPWVIATSAKGSQYESKIDRLMIKFTFGSWIWKRSWATTSTLRRSWNLIGKPSAHTRSQANLVMWFTAGQVLKMISLHARWVHELELLTTCLCWAISFTIRFPVWIRRTERSIRTGSERNESESDSYCIGYCGSGETWRVQDPEQAGKSVERQTGEPIHNQANFTCGYENSILVSIWCCVVPTLKLHKDQGVEVRLASVLMRGRNNSWLHPWFSHCRNSWDVCAGLAGALAVASSTNGWHSSEAVGSWWGEEEGLLHVGWWSGNMYDKRKKNEGAHWGSQCHSHDRKVCLNNYKLNGWWVWC